MHEPIETPAEETPAEETPADETAAAGARAKDPATPPRDEIIATHEEERTSAGPALSHAISQPDAANAPAPLQEIAAAFRMNAEALHTLKQMQGDLADSVKRGDRSELVLQSTRALNDTFRNLTAVQRELLARLDGSRPTAAPGRSPLVPLLILGLLIVMLGGIYVILDTLDEQAARNPELAPAEVARRERDSWKEGRSEGAQHADAEIRRLEESLEEAKERRRTLERELDAKVGELGAIDRGKRTAELERDEFAGQVRKAQNEVLAKKALEGEILSLRMKVDGADRITERLRQDLDLQRRTNGFLRRRLADYGMGYTEDDPMWRPGVSAGADDPAAPGRIEKLPESAAVKKRRLELLIAGRKKMGMPTDDLENALAAGGAPGVAAASGSGSGPGTPSKPRKQEPKIPWARSAVPPPAAHAEDDHAEDDVADAPPAPPSTGGPAIRPAAQPPVPAADTFPPAAPRGAAYGGDRPGTLPPPILRKRGALQRDLKSVGRVRAHLNRLLDDGSGGAGWQVQRLDGVAEDRLAGVVLTRYDAAGRLVESVEARDVRITLDRARRSVEFRVTDGVRVAQNRRVALPTAGARILVAEGSDAERWGSSQLTVIHKR